MKKIYLSLILAGVTSLGFGQVTINGTDFNANIGESFDYQLTDYILPGPAGASQTWDLTAVIVSGSSTVNYSAANGSFSATNITQSDVTGGGEFYADFSASGQYVHGISGSGVVITYSDPITNFEYPLSMGSSGSDTHSATFTSGSFAFTRAGSTTWEVDGWGTVITPQGTFADVLRVKITQTYTDTYSGGTIDYYVEVYQWIKPGIHYPIASMSTIDNTVGGTTSSSSSGSYAAGNVGINELSTVDFMAYPNPTTDVIYVSSTSDIAAVIVTDLSGKEVAKATGNSVDIADLNNGLYLVSITTAEGVTSVGQRIAKK